MTKSPDLTVREAAAELNVSTGQVHNLIKKMLLPAINVGSGDERALWRIPRESLDAYRAAALKESAKRFGGTELARRLDRDGAA